MSGPRSSWLKCLGTICSAGCNPCARAGAAPAKSAEQAALDDAAEAAQASAQATAGVLEEAAPELPGEDGRPVPGEAEAAAGLDGKGHPGTGAAPDPDDALSDDASGKPAPQDHEAALPEEGGGAGSQDGPATRVEDGDDGEASVGTSEGAQEAWEELMGQEHGHRVPAWDGLALGLGGREDLEAMLPRPPVPNPFRNFPGVPPAGARWEPRAPPGGLFLQWPRLPPALARRLGCCRRARGLERLERDRSRSSQGLQRRWAADASAPSGVQLNVATLAGEGVGSVPVSAGTTGAELRQRVARLAGVPEHEVKLVLQGGVAPIQDQDPVLTAGEERLQGPSPQVMMLRVRRRLALGGFSDGTLKLWDLNDGSCRETLRGHRLPVGGLAADWSSRRALSGSLDGTLRLWDLDRGSCVESLPDCHLSGCNCLSVDWTERRALAGLADGMLALWDLEEAECIEKLRRGHAGPVQCCAAGWAESCALSGSTDGALLLWNLELGTFLDLQGHRVWVSGVEMDDTARHAVSGSIDGMIRLWELRSSSCVRAWKGQWNDVKCMSVNWDTGQVLSGSGGGSLKCWDLGSGRAMEVTPGGGGIRQDVQCLAVDWRSRSALSGSVGGRLALWDLETGSASCELQADGNNTVKCVSMTTG